MKKIALLFLLSLVICPPFLFPKTMDLENNAISPLLYRKALNYERAIPEEKERAQKYFMKELVEPRARQCIYFCIDMVFHQAWIIFGFLLDCQEKNILFRGSPAIDFDIKDRYGNNILHVLCEMEAPEQYIKKIITLNPLLSLEMNHAKEYPSVTLLRRSDRPELIKFLLKSDVFFNHAEMIKIAERYKREESLNVIEEDLNAPSYFTLSPLDLSLFSHTPSPITPYSSTAGDTDDEREGPDFDQFLTTQF